MAVRQRGLLSQYTAQMTSLSRPQGRRWMVVLALIGLPFFLWSLWSLEIGRESRHPYPAHPHITTPVDPGLPFKDIRPHPPYNNAPQPEQTAIYDAEQSGVVESGHPASQPTSAPSTVAVTDRPLILYALFETPLAIINFKFYLNHALHDAADFLFIFNGDTDAYKYLPKASNIKYVTRANDCYDLGAFAEVLLKDDLYKKYNRYITMNSSIRGPFLPVWAMGACWSDMYLNLITEEVKLVGMTMNCQYENHIQSMIWATDRIGLEVLLFPTDTEVANLKEILAARPLPSGAPLPALGIPGINSCPHLYWDAVAIEVYATSLVKAAGYKVTAMMSAYHSTTTQRYEEHCEANGDILIDGGYYGMNLHPFDTLFAKTNRDIAPMTLKLLTEWMDGRGYSSYDFCR